MTKSLSAKLLLPSIFIYSTLASGQPAAGNAPFVGVVPPIVAQPGQYDINSRDVSRAMSEVIARIGKVQDSDLAYLDSVVREMVKAANEYNSLLTVGEFKKLSDKSYSQGTTGVPVEQFLTVLNQVREARLKIETNLQLLTSIANALPSDQVINDGKVSNALPAPRKIDFSKVISSVTDRIVQAEALANNYPFVIVHAEGLQIIKTNSGKALNPTLTFPLMTGERIAALQKQVRLLSTPSTVFIRATESHGNLTKGLIAKFINNYGRSEKYRPRDEKDEVARRDAFGQIVNAFWMRSYLRKVYGVRVGAIIPENYKKRYLKIDKFTILTEQLTTFKEETSPADVDDGVLSDAAESIRNTLELLDDRAAKILSGDASFIARINSFITFMKGERPTAEALLMVMGLVAADIKEEQELSLGGGLQTLMAMYDQKFGSTDADKKKADTRVCAFDHLANLAAGNANCYQGNPESGIKGVFLTLNEEANAQSTKIENAMKIREEIRLAQLANSLTGQDGKATGAAGRRGH